MHSEDLELLRKIRGRFQDSISNQRRDLVVLFLFGIIFPAILLLFFFFDPERFRFVFAAMALVSIILCALIWRDRNVEYEFTGDEIIERRGGRTRNRMRISDIIETKVEFSPHYHQLKLNSISSKMTIHIFPDLNAVIQKETAEMMTKASESEQQHLEQVKQEMIARQKRINKIGAIIIVPAVFAIFSILLLVGYITVHLLRWFEGKP